MRLGSRVSKVRTHVSNAPDVGAIMNLQDVHAVYAFNACKTYGHVATVWLQCSVDPVDHLHDTATVSDTSTAWHHAVDRVRPGKTTRQDVPHVIEDILYYF
jgi:hypothetical protein